MTLFSFGLPGRFGDWCEVALARLAEAQSGPVAPISPGSAEELAAELIRAEAVSQVLITARRPGVWLRRLVPTTGKRLVVALDDPRSAMWDLVTQHGADLVEATRLLGCSCASILPCLVLPEALVLHAERDWAYPTATIEAMARHFGLASGPDAIEGIGATLAAGFGPEQDRTAWDPERLSEADRSIVHSALDAYVDHFAGLPLGRITWNRELFLTDGQQPAIGPIDVTGRVRALIYGPYVRLPQGSWAAEVVLGFSQEAAGVAYVVDVKTGDTVLSSTNIHPSEHGIYTVNLHFVIAEGNDHTVEFRVINEHAAFDGKVMLGHVGLTLQHEPPRSAVDRLSAELRLSP